MYFVLPIYNNKTHTMIYEVIDRITGWALGLHLSHKAETTIMPNKISALKLSSFIMKLLVKLGFDEPPNTPKAAS